MIELKFKPQITLEYFEENDYSVVTYSIRLLKNAIAKEKSKVTFELGDRVFYAHVTTLGNIRIQRVE